MTEEMTTPRPFDLRPHPRILPMLGEINLSQSRCLAELVDNAVDGFLAARASGSSTSTPEVHIAVPTVDDARAKITVRDNGPGMDPETLESAVQAGWTSHDPINSLGMFGMGFNIATARLGTLTRVWSAREADTEWSGLEIDFEKLVEQGHFFTPQITRPKSDPREHGTEVTVERLKPEQRAWLSRAANHSKLSHELARMYSSMLRTNGVPISFKLILKGNAIRGRDHCIWGGEGNPPREVATSKGVVSAYQSIDTRLADRPFCTKCWQWLPYNDDKCPACESTGNVVRRERRVYGWIGLQRYLSRVDYGIDFLRHGRKIEIANTDLFNWTDEQSVEPEYPIDDPRNRGRIVGEIHLDHCRVTYTKDRFDRNDPAWDEMVRIVRGDGPLRPDKAHDLGFGQNTSPLFVLFQVFRRSTPKPKVAGAYAKLLIVPDNDKSEAMAKRFYAAEADYQTDAKWWELVEEADRELLVPPAQAADPAPGLAGFPGAVQGVDGDQDGVVDAAPVAQPPPRIAVASLTSEYRDDLTNQRWNVRGWSVQQSDADLGDKPWAVRATPGGTDEYLFNGEHEVFQSATLTPLDALLAELAWRAMDFQRGNPSGATFASILSGLRARYGGPNKLDPITIGNEAGSALTALAKSLARNVGLEDARILFQALQPSEQDAIQQRMAVRSVRNPDEVISGGRFLEYAPRKTLLRFFERHPELFFDGKYWDDVYATLDYGNAAATEEGQAQLVSYYASLVVDAIWLAEQEPDDLAAASRSRLLRASLAIELLAPFSPQEAEA